MTATSLQDAFEGPSIERRSSRSEHGVGEISPTLTRKRQSYLDRTTRRFGPNRRRNLVGTYTGRIDFTMQVKQLEAPPLPKAAELERRVAHALQGVLNEVLLHLDRTEPIREAGRNGLEDFDIDITLTVKKVTLV